MNFKILFPLPFDIPIPSKYPFVSSYLRNGEQFDLKLVFSTVEGYQKFPWMDKEEKVTVTVATVELNLVDIKPNSEITRSLIRKAFKISLDYLNRYLTAFRTTVAAYRIHTLTIAHLPETLEILINDEIVALYSTFIEDDITDVEELPFDLLTRVGNKMNIWDDYPEVMAVDGFFENAKSYLAKEELPYAIIEFQTSFELFLRNSYRYILTSKSTPQAEIEKLVSIRNLKVIITKKLGPLLDVDLGYQTPGPMKDWNDNLYTLRNKVVHNGQYNITKQQALNAQEAYINARDYITDCMVAKGFLSQDKKIDLSVFKRPFSDEEMESKVRERLIRTGLLPKDKPISTLAEEKNKDDSD